MKGGRRDWMKFRPWISRWIHLWMMICFHKAKILDPKVLRRSYKETGMSIMNRYVWSVHLIHHQLRIRVTQLTLLPANMSPVEILHSLFFAFLWTTKIIIAVSLVRVMHACRGIWVWKRGKNCQWLLWIPFFTFNLLTWDRTEVLMRFGNPFHVTIEWDDSPSFCRHQLPDSQAKRFEERCSHSMISFVTVWLSSKGCFNQKANTRTGRKNGIISTHAHVTRGNQSCGRTFSWHE